MLWGKYVGKCLKICMCIYNPISQRYAVQCLLEYQGFASHVCLLSFCNPTSFHLLCVNPEKMNMMSLTSEWCVYVLAHTRIIFLLKDIHLDRDFQLPQNTSETEKFFVNSRRDNIILLSFLRTRTKKEKIKIWFDISDFLWRTYIYQMVTS